MWFITRQAAQYYDVQTVERIWAGKTYDEGRHRLMALLREYIDTFNEHTHFLGPEGPEEFVKADLDDIKDELVVINNAPNGSPIKLFLCGWKIVLWGTPDDKPNASDIGYL